MTIASNRENAQPYDRTVLEREWNVILHGRPVSIADRYDVEDPSNGQVLASVPECSEEDVDRAVRAAAAAQVEWRVLTPRSRAEKLRELAVLIREHREELATLDAWDAGFALPIMRKDVESGAEHLDFMADLALELSGRTVPASENFHYTLSQPYGVVARIAPFNHPFFFASAKIAAPLIAGNAVVLKAPNQTPLSTLRLAELAGQVLPLDLVQVVSGSGHVAGSALVRHPLIRRIGFTGSPETGRAIQRDAANAGVKNVSLELGGKNALIAFEDADPEEIANAAVQGMNFTITAGQSCGSTSRLLLHESLKDDVLGRVAELVDSIRVGHPLDPSTQMGPVISRAQYDKTLNAIATGTSEGASVIAGGGRPDNLGEEGWFVRPTVLADVAPDSTVGQTEIFGPVLAAMTFRTDEEALAISNNVEYGLTAAIWTNDIRRAHRMARDVEAGFVWINGTSRHYLGLPFGGTKSSGIGREASSEELLSYTEQKSVTVML